MMARTCRTGFTLVELLIVVVIMAILAATIIPQFSDSSKDAKVSTLKFDLHTLRSQIELYRAQHDGRVPQDDTTLAELVSKTDEFGEISESGAYGPYVQSIPVNPFSKSDEVRAATDANKGTVVYSGNQGWLYDKATGQIWIDWSPYVEE